MSDERNVLIEILCICGMSEKCIKAILVSLRTEEQVYKMLSMIKKRKPESEEDVVGYLMKIKGYK